jgi:hypothetical protein
MNRQAHGHILPPFFFQSRSGNFRPDFPGGWGRVLLSLLKAISAKSTKLLTELSRKQPLSPEGSWVLPPKTSHRILIALAQHFGDSSRSTLPRGLDLLRYLHRIRRLDIIGRRVVERVPAPLSVSISSTNGYLEFFLKILQKGWARGITLMLQ